MKIKIITNFKLLPAGYSAIMLYPFILTRYSTKDLETQAGRVLLKHELTHVHQVKNYGWFSFYISYFIYFLAGLIRFKAWTPAYYDIPYEREAVDNQLTPLTETDKLELGLESNLH